MTARRLVVVVVAHVAACHHWVRVDAVERVGDERIRVERPDGSVEELEHARPCGPTSLGGVYPGHPDTCDCATTCAIADVARDRVRVRRINPWTTTGIVVGSVVAAFVVAFLIVVASGALGAAGG